MTPGVRDEDHRAGGERPWLGHPRLSLLIATTWLLLQGSLGIADWLWAAVIGLVLPWLLHDFIGPGRRARAAAAAVKLVALVLWDIVRANLTVARIVLDPTREPTPAWLHVRHTLSDPRAVALLATIITATPGTVSCVVDEEGHSILVHALDTTDPHAVAADILARYEPALREIFE